MHRRSCCPFFLFPVRSIAFDAEKILVSVHMSFNIGLSTAQHNTLLGQLISSKTSLIILHLFHIGRLFVLSFVRSFVSVRSAIQYSSIALFIGYFALSAAFINCIYACLNYIITYTYCASENWNRPQPTMNNVLSVRSNGRSRV